MNKFRAFNSSIFGVLIILISFVLHADKASWEVFSQSGSLKVLIQPQAEQYQIGQYHNWIIVVKDLSGYAIDDVNITVEGGMLGHGHGLPSQPIVTEYFGDGSYLIEGMLFNMSGEWTLNFYIQNSSYKDRARFDIELSF
ncbi:MAG: FixH family protein [Gammaproteobacteria bacterium]|nr:FixH family protein [Gammaproteobacteria bacterium]